MSAPLRIDGPFRQRPPSDPWHQFVVVALCCAGAALVCVLACLGVAR